MPYSSDEGKDWMRRQIAALQPRMILDIGVGSGTYADLLRPLLPGAKFLGIEVHKPYVDQFRLREKYDSLRVCDARTAHLAWPDVVILGDVLEHMPLADAVFLWAKCRDAATRAVFLSLPIVEWPQGPVSGNEHEAHLVTWSHQMVLRHLPGITEFELHEHIGVYRADPC